MKDYAERAAEVLQECRSVREVSSALRSITAIPRSRTEDLLATAKAAVLDYQKANQDYIDGLLRVIEDQGHEIGRLNELLKIEKGEVI